MAIKQQQHIFKGMQRDLSVSKFSNEYAFDAHNIRITARDNNTLLTVTNERGTKELPISYKDKPVSIEGTILGYNVLNNFVTIFTTGTTDRIIRLELVGKEFEYIELFAGNLMFKADSPIESLGIYENDNIQKVYWIDGINQTRVINITAPQEVKDKWEDTSFDFIQGLSLYERAVVKRNELSSGLFSSGVIQYAFTYYNMYGQESNIFYTTPIAYISTSNSGSSPEDKVGVSFEIDLYNVDKRFDYVRVYSIHRASIDGLPSVNLIRDIHTSSTVGSKLTFIDDGTRGSTIDPSQLLYMGGEEIVFKTMTQKDNTLFLGNALIKRKMISQKIINLLRESKVGFYAGSSLNTPIDGAYPYKNNLSEGSRVKTFKYLEWYRVGIQLQHKSGKWSEPIWVKDIQNKMKPTQIRERFFPTHMKILPPTEAINLAKEDGFLNARSVVVYPTEADREVVAQGILCPTVYNVKDRFENGPFVQSSWFSRPSLPYDIEDNKTNWEIIESINPNLVVDIKKDYNRYGSVVNNEDYKYDPEVVISGKTDLIPFGAWAEFRHNYPLPNNWERNAEIQSSAGVLDNPRVKTADKIEQYVDEYSNTYMVDQSIFTFHSPEIEFSPNAKNFETDNLQLRIVGLINITGSSSDIDIQTKTPPNTILNEPGFKGFPIGSINQNVHGFKNLLGGSFWLDKLDSISNSVVDGILTSFFIYPWHRNGSLNNQGIAEEGKTRTALLDKKKLSNIKTATYNTFFNSPWNAFQEGDNNKQGINGVAIFDSKELKLTRLQSPLNSDLDDLNYYGNIDRVITPYTSNSNATYQVTRDTKEGIKTETFYKKDGYPIVYTGTMFENSDFTQVFKGTMLPLTFSKYNTEPNSKINFGNDPIRMKYKSDIHAVIGLNYTKEGYQRILPTLMSNPMEYTIHYPDGSVGEPSLMERVANQLDDTLLGGKECFFWDKRLRENLGNQNYIGKVSQDVIEEKTDTGYLFLAELYRPNSGNKFGGQTEEAFENNQWLPAGEPVLLSSMNPTNNNMIEITQGDTFYMRYDCLKTYPSTLEDQNSVSEIVSFMCETRINLDGRYDKNRGQLSNLTVSPENFNKLNPVYSQKDNFFNYRGINPKRFKLDYFPNTVTWTKEKFAGSLTDSWTNITMASTLDLDGDKGEVVSLNTLNNEIFCFQKQGLSNILFNSRVQIPTSDGVPIEISNGMKVQGKRYISNTIGCSNKWSIAESPQGLYFVDDITNSIYLFNGQVNSISDKLGFRQWVGSRNTTDSWTPEEYNNIRTYYDKNNNDVYFTYKDTSLVYSELVGQFISFMDYGGVPAMFNVGAEYYSINKSKLWHNFNGDYNMFYGEFKPFDITFVSNADPSFDKIFNTLEFRADSWDNSTLSKGRPFTSLEVWNEYQRGESNLEVSNGRPSPLKKMFRVWRANIPRAMENNRDRIRNTWAYIKLSNRTPNTKRMEFHDAIVHYFI